MSSMGSSVGSSSGGTINDEELFKEDKDKGVIASIPPGQVGIPIPEGGLRLPKKSDEPLILSIKCIATALLFISYSFGSYGTFVMNPLFAACFNDPSTDCDAIQGVRVLEGLYIGLAWLGLFFALISFAFGGLGEGLRGRDAILQATLGSISLFAIAALVVSVIKLKGDGNQGKEGVKMWARISAIVIGFIAVITHVVLAILMVTRCGSVSRGKSGGGPQGRCDYLPIMKTLVTELLLLFYTFSAFLYHMKVTEGMGEEDKILAGVVISVTIFLLLFAIGSLALEGQMGMGHKFRPIDGYLHIAAGVVVFIITGIFSSEVFSSCKIRCDNWLWLGHLGLIIGVLACFIHLGIGTRSPGLRFAQFLRMHHQQRQGQQGAGPPPDIGPIR